MARAESKAERTGTKMHQTTLRFGPDLWDALEAQAALAGVSVAQYVRDAALMRISNDGARLGDPS